MHPKQGVSGQNQGTKVFPKGPKTRLPSPADPEWPWAPSVKAKAFVVPPSVGKVCCSSHLWAAQQTRCLVGKAPFPTLAELLLFCLLRAALSV